MFPKTRNFHWKNWVGPRRKLTDRNVTFFVVVNQHNEKKRKITIEAILPKNSKNCILIILNHFFAVYISWKTINLAYSFNSEFNVP